MSFYVWVKVLPKGGTLSVGVSSGWCCNHVDALRAVYQSICSYVLTLADGSELRIVTKEQHAGKTSPWGRADPAADMLQGLQCISQLAPDSLGIPREEIEDVGCLGVVRLVCRHHERGEHEGGEKRRWRASGSPF